MSGPSLSAAAPVACSAPVRLPLRLPGVPELTCVDVVAPASPERVRQLQEVHLRHFPSYPHVADEIAQYAREGSPDPEVVVHQLLLLRDGAPVGEFLVHANLRREVVLRHHLALDAPARAGLPVAWLRRLIDTAAGLAARDAAAAQRPLRAMVSEVQPQHLAGWIRLGYEQLDVGYAEPAGGPGWAGRGGPEFLPITPVLGGLPDGEGWALADLAVQGLSAFLLDHYRLPADHPVVAGILERAAGLPGTVRSVLGPA